MTNERKRALDALDKIPHGFGDSVYAAMWQFLKDHHDTIRAALSEPEKNMGARGKCDHAPITVSASAELADAIERSWSSFMIMPATGGAECFVRYSDLCTIITAAQETEKLRARITELEGFLNDVAERRAI